MSGGARRHSSLLQINKCWEYVVEMIATFTLVYRDG